MDKFKHPTSDETKYKQGGADMILTTIIIFALLVFGAIWYHQYKVYPEQVIEDKRMKEMQVEYRRLQSEIEKIQKSQQPEEK